MVLSEFVSFVYRRPCLISTIHTGIAFLVVFPLAMTLLSRSMLDDYLLRHEQGQMADAFTPKDVYFRGMELGAKLHEGKVDEVEPKHEALINRIREENKDNPRSAQNLIDLVHAGMYETAPEDVAAPGHGTEKGYYVYFGPERAVNRALGTLKNFCEPRSQCDGVGVTNPMPQYVTPAEAANKSPKGQAEMANMLKELNNSLFFDKDLPTGLEASVFVEDFNRRARHIFRARKSETFHAEIHLADDP